MARRRPNEVLYERRMDSLFFRGIILRQVRKSWQDIKHANLIDTFVSFRFILLQDARRNGPRGIFIQIALISITER